jgi:hypothetical protein
VGRSTISGALSKVCEHQADIQARKEQTGERNLFCSERYKAPVCFTRKVKNFLP